MNPQLEAVQRAGGAAFARVGGRELPTRFRDVQTEWSAVRQRCGMLDLGFRGLLRINGADRVTFLQGMVSNDVACLRDGQGTYAAVLTQQGRVVSDLRIYVLTDEIWIDTPAERTDAVRENLERYIVADDVEFIPGDDWVPLVALEGPQAPRAVLSVAGEAIDDLAPFAHRSVTFDGATVRVAAASHSGEKGYVVFGRPDSATSLWERCRAAGAEPVGMDALEVLRLEAGIPWYGRDMDESTLVGEVGLQSAISFTKGCYLGQEVVERVAARGQVQRKLVGLVCDGQHVPTAGSTVTHDGKEVGWITSAAWSPARAAVIALGYVRRECWDPDSEVGITADGEAVRASIVTLPFYSERT